MKIKTAELDGFILRYVVGNLEGYQSRCPWMLEQDGFRRWQGYESSFGAPLPHYDSESYDAWKIVDRERITIKPYSLGTDWFATLPSATGGHLLSGPTIFIAALRCYVASKLGDEVEIPDVKWD